MIKYYGDHRNIKLLEKPKSEQGPRWSNWWEREQKKKALIELERKIKLVKERGTWDGVDVDKFMDEVRGRTD